MGIQNEVCVAKVSVLGTSEFNRCLAVWQGAEGSDLDRERFFQECGAAVRGIVQRHSAVRSSDVDDVVQEILMMMLDPRRVQPCRGSVRAYLKILTNRYVASSVEKATAQKRKPTIGEGDGRTYACVVSLEEDPQIAAEHESAVQAEYQQERFAKLQSVLPAPQQRIIELMLQDFSQKEIASRLKISERTVRRRLAVIREKENALLN